VFTLLLTMSEPVLGSIADRSGLPASYFGLAGGLSLLTLFPLWTSHHHFPSTTIVT
jgi:hypothetical protein